MRSNNSSGKMFSVITRSGSAWLTWPNTREKAKQCQIFEAHALWCALSEPTLIIKELDVSSPEQIRPIRSEKSPKSAAFWPSRSCGAALRFIGLIGQAGNTSLILVMMLADRESFESWDTARTLLPGHRSILLAVQQHIKQERTT